jgi:Uma2 family endonuclease
MTRAITPVSTDRELTFEEYLATPETKSRQEVINGVIVMSPSPNFRHQLILGNLYRSIFYHLLLIDLGTVVIAPADLLIRKIPKLQVRQPDLMIVPHSRIGREELKDVNVLEVVPDLAVEILSQSDTLKRMAEKLADYASIRVSEVWLIDPDTESFEVHSLADDQYTLTGRFTNDDEVQSGILPGFGLPVRSIFV